MERQIIEINEEKCNGCGLCVTACHEGAIQMVDGKATLIRDDYCDGLGNCLPVCPTGAITFTVREAAEYDEAAVLENQRKAELAQKEAEKPMACGCPGTHARAIQRKSAEAVSAPKQAAAAQESQLSQWPVQIKLVPVNAPYFDGANLLIAADCTAYAYANFHEDFIKGRITLIGCPKLDEGDYSEKLTAILKNNNIQSVTVVRMEVPCCSGLANAAVNALKDCGKMIPWNVVIVGTDGEIRK